MTDILLIQPPIRDFYLTTKRTIPYGLACLASTLIQDGFSVRIVDGLASTKSRILDLPEEMTYLNEFYGKADRSPFAFFSRFKHFGYSFNHIAKIAKASQAFLVGVSCLFTPYMQEAIETAETVKAFHPSCKIVMGGHHPTADPQSVMQSPAVDFVLRGEGEVSVSLLAKAIKKGGLYENIPGLVYRKPNGDLLINSPAVMDKPDRYPLPANHLINHKFYMRAKKGSAVIVASRGCPMKCTYCSVGASSYLTFRRRSVASVIREIETAIVHDDVGFIDFEDENLALDRKWFLKLLQQIELHFGRNHLELRAMNGLFPPSLDDEVIEAMKAAGFKTLNLSLGSTSPEQLSRFQRPDAKHAFDRALTLCEKHGLKAVGYIIIGAPFQQAQDSLSDLLFLAERRVLAGLSVFYPALGSRDYDLCDKLGILPKTFSCMRSSALPLSHTTTRLETIPLLRLGRILNFMKYLLDKCEMIQQPMPQPAVIENTDDRIETGKLLLQRFLYDGKILGITSKGDVFEHNVAMDLTNNFLERLKSLHLRGCTYREKEF